MNICVKNNDDISVEEFHGYWLTRHGPLVKFLRESLRIMKYIQSHAGLPEPGDMATSQRCMKSMYDELTELWWENVDVLSDSFKYWK